MLLGEDQVDGYVLFFFFNPVLVPPSVSVRIDVPMARHTCLYFPILDALSDRNPD